jgi:hypothetical protein
MFSCCFRKRRSSAKTSCTSKCRARHRTNSIKNVAQCCDVSEFDVVELCKSLCDTRPSANASTPNRTSAGLGSVIQMVQLIEPIGMSAL